MNKQVFCLTLLFVLSLMITSTFSAIVRNDSHATKNSKNSWDIKANASIDSIAVPSQSTPVWTNVTTKSSVSSYSSNITKTVKRLRCIKKEE